MRNILIALLLIALTSCQKDETIISVPTVTLKVNWVTTQAFALTGDVIYPLDCFRGFLVSTKQGATMYADGAKVYIYATGRGEYNLIVGCEAKTTYYFRAWAHRPDGGVQYSEEVSFKTW